MRWKPQCGGSPNWSPTEAAEGTTNEKHPEPVVAGCLLGLGSELVECPRQRRLLVGRLVLVDDPLARGFVQLATGRSQQLGGLVLLAGLGGLAERANSRAKRRLHRLVAQSPALVGAVTLLLRLDVGHAVVPSSISTGVFGLHMPGQAAATDQAISSRGVLPKPSPLACGNGRRQGIATISFGYGRPTTAGTAAGAVGRDLHRPAVGSGGDRRRARRRHAAAVRAGRPG